MPQPVSSVGSFGPTPISTSTPEAADARSEAPAGTSTWQGGIEPVKDGMEMFSGAIAKAGATGKTADPVQPSPPPADQGVASSKEAADKEKTAAFNEVQKHTVPQLMKMLREGNLPDIVLDHPEAMVMLNARVQEYSRMIQMMTNIMQAEHETLMAIIRNLKA